jgi:phosphoglycolate phosphatase
MRKASDAKLLLFDLDGTLTDPKEGITKSVQYALKTFGIDISDSNGLLKFIGPPLRESFKKYYGFSTDDANRAVEKYREYFLEFGIFENTMYDGIDYLLEELTENGKALMVATSKPTIQAEAVLRHFNLLKYFTFISGAELDGRRSEKCEVITYALEINNAFSPGCAVMIGDREHDIIGARKTGIASVGVAYGYGGFDELSRAGADDIVTSVDELRKLFLNY